MNGVYLAGGISRGLPPVEVVRYSPSASKISSLQAGGIAIRLPIFWEQVRQFPDHETMLPADRWGARLPPADGLDPLRDHRRGREAELARDARLRELADRGRRPDIGPSGALAAPCSRRPEVRHAGAEGGVAQFRPKPSRTRLPRRWGALVIPALLTLNFSPIPWW